MALYGCHVVNFRLRLNPFYQPDSEITNRQFIQRVKHCGQRYLGIGWFRENSNHFPTVKSFGSRSFSLLVFGFYQKVWVSNFSRLLCLYSQFKVTRYNYVIFHSKRLSSHKISQNPNKKLFLEWNQRNERRFISLVEGLSLERSPRLDGLMVLGSSLGCSTKKTRFVILSSWNTPEKPTLTWSSTFDLIWLSARFLTRVKKHV